MALCHPALFLNSLSTCDVDSYRFRLGFGTFAPRLRASERPIAMACLRLVTFLPLRPDFNLPRFISCIARLTFLPALGLYFLGMAFIIKRYIGDLSGSFDKYVSAEIL